MMFQTLKVAIVAAALAVCGTSIAQDCGSCGGAVSYGGSASYGTDNGGANCGRGITQGQAAALWAGYCTENCGYTGGNDCGCESSCDSGCGGGHGCSLGSRLGSRGGKLRGMFSGSGGSSCGGCDLGCFGYPSDCGGCGNDGGGFLSGGLMKGGCFSGLRGKLGNRGGCGCGSSFGGKLGNHGCGGGCNVGGKLKGMFAGRSGCGCGSNFGSRIKGLFHRSKNDCGCAGAYFGESVGHEYGTTGMQSCVSGCGTNAVAPVVGNGCGGNSVFSDNQSGEVFLGVQDPIAHAQEVPAEVTEAVGAVETLNNDAGH